VKSASNEQQIHVVLVEPEIHWNTGNVGRTTLAAGARLHLVEPLGFSIESRQVRRAGLDYWPSVKPRIWASWASLEPSLESMGTPFFFCPRADQVIWEADLTAPAVLVFGSETRGLPQEILSAHPNRLVSIPQATSTVRSLNLSTCVGIAVYECLRQTRSALDSGC
jgi:tRNA (cytidine/uridine-2'-O-)-methyltransferase